MRRTQVICIDCVNHNCLLQHYLSKELAPLIYENKTIIKCKKDQQIFLEGMPVVGIYFLLSGKVKIYKSGTNEKQQVIRLVKPGDILGHRGIGSRNIYPVGACALEDSMVCFMETKIFFDVLHKEPDLTFQLMLFYADELQKMEASVRNQALMTIREKVANTLLMIIGVFGLTGDNKIDAQLSRQDIAEIAGTNKEQVSRFLSEFQRDKIISMKVKNIKIINIEKLKHLISEYEY